MAAVVVIIHIVNDSFIFMFGNIQTDFLTIYNNFPDVKDTSEFDNSSLKYFELLGTTHEEIYKLRKLFYVKKFVASLGCNV
jgi:hypothetical protein